MYSAEEEPKIMITEKWNKMFWSRHQECKGRVKCCFTIVRELAHGDDRATEQEERKFKQKEAKGNTIHMSCIKLPQKIYT